MDAPPRGPPPPAPAHRPAPQPLLQPPVPVPPNPSATGSAAGTGAAGTSGRIGWASRRCAGRVSGVLVLVLVVVAGLIATVSMWPFPDVGKLQRIACVNGMQQAGGLWIATAARRHAPPGANILEDLLRWNAKDPFLGDGSFLRCPADLDALPPGTIVNWRTLDPAHPPAGVCSWALRDLQKHPIPEPAEELQILAACTHHANGVIVVWDDGAARFIGCSELGLPPGSLVTIGPTSPVVLLRTLVAPTGPK